jgi:CDP-4-dehydro-6-deoxyglucose reductase, E3
VRVRVVNSSSDFEVARDQSVLDAALRASWSLPHSCKGGNCGLCKARLLRGEIDYPNGRPLGLSDAEIDSGFILLCQAQARSDLDLELQEMRSAHEHGAARIPCRIERATLAAHDVMIVLLRLPPAVDFFFQAGQYIDIMLGHDRRRSFSIASPPKDARCLELHVRRVPGGEWTEWLFGSGSVAGALIGIEGPLGRFHYREEPSHSRPMLLVGGGTGIAPLLCILRHLVDTESQRELIVYWGVRSARDLYVEAAILELASRLPHLRYVAVLSEPDPAWPGRSGLVHAAVLEDLRDLSAFDIYAAGPPAMIEALRCEFPQHGAAIDRLYCDSFDYAVDSLERQRTSAATKS